MSHIVENNKKSQLSLVNEMNNLLNSFNATATNNNKFVNNVMPKKEVSSRIFYQYKKGKNDNLQEEINKLMSIYQQIVNECIYCNP
ncbi:hypothetical protein ABK040_005902 [Willaertia magna]